MNGPEEGITYDERREIARKRWEFLRQLNGTEEKGVGVVVHSTMYFDALVTLHLGCYPQVSLRMRRIVSDAELVWVMHDLVKGGVAEDSDLRIDSAGRAFHITRRMPVQWLPSPTRRMHGKAKPTRDRRRVSEDEASGWVHTVTRRLVALIGTSLKTHDLAVRSGLDRGPQLDALLEARKPKQVGAKSPDHWVGYPPKLRPPIPLSRAAPLPGQLEIMKARGKEKGKPVRPDGPPQGGIAVIRPMPAEPVAVPRMCPICGKQVLSHGLVRHKQCEGRQVPAAGPSGITRTAQTEYQRLVARVEAAEPGRHGARAVRLNADPVRSQAARKAVLLRAGGRCENPACAGMPDDVTDSGEAILEVDHVMEIAAGGRDHPVQMVALCPNCHALKTRGRKRSVLRGVLLELAGRQHALWQS
ncbi:hypothetical protein ABIA33_003979 [Streptacidiphilus sp. MAP12-16]|uniref:HNH endonuclease n=1 Tax=Streptacidiphilus sp. MAP12-16 TaxID=3156300 RepID=UPI0035131DAE